MPGREDALVQAATAILSIQDADLEVEGAVATVGELDVQAGRRQCDSRSCPTLGRRPCA